MPAAEKDFYAALDAVYESGEEGAVEKFLTGQAAEYGKEQGGQNTGFLKCMSELGAYYRGVSRYGESIAAFQKADELLVRLCGVHSPERATNLNNLAGAYRMKGDFDTALGLFSQSLEIYDAQPEKNNYLYAGALNNISLLYQSKQEYGTARDYLRQSIALLETSPELRAELAVAYANLSSLCQQSGDIPGAKENLDRAIGIFRSLPEEDGHYAAALNSKAVLLAGDGAYGEAKAVLLEALAKTKACFSENADYGGVCRNLARICVRLGEREEALRYMGMAGDVFQRVFGEDHAHTRGIRREREELLRAGPEQ